jgi:hypothetical protein
MVQLASPSFWNVAVVMVIAASLLCYVLKAGE